MARYLWVFDESDCGGMAEQDEIDNLLQQGACISTMRAYVERWRQGYDMDWTPPEWIQDIFPAEQK